MLAMNAIWPRAALGVSVPRERLLTNRGGVLRCPPCHGVRQMLGYVYKQLPGKRALAIELLRKVTSAQPDDLDAWVELAELLEGTDVAKALQGTPLAQRVALTRQVRGAHARRSSCNDGGRDSRSLRKGQRAPHQGERHGASCGARQQRCGSAP